MRVASLHIHPVKGMRAVDATRAQIGPRGPAGDRRWLVVDRTACSSTQRSHPVLATLTASLDGDALC
ncbi:MAG: MOSC N-terminal beta barrel domain-containing protein [Parvularculaceae bacterium]